MHVYSECIYPHSHSFPHLTHSPLISWCHCLVLLLYFLLLRKKVLTSTGAWATSQQPHPEENVFSLSSQPIVPQLSPELWSPSFTHVRMLAGLVLICVAGNWSWCEFMRAMATSCLKDAFHSTLLHPLTLALLLLPFLWALGGRGWHSCSFWGWAFTSLLLSAPGWVLSLC